VKSENILVKIVSFYRERLHRYDELALNISAAVLSFSSIRQMVPIFDIYTAHDHPWGVRISRAIFGRDPMKNVDMHKEQSNR